MSTFEEFRSRKIKVFRNGDTWTPGKKMVISNRVFRNYEQFLYQIAENVPLTSGAVRRMYSIDGTPVKSLGEIKDGGMYVASGGDSFKRVPYLIEDDPIAETPMKSRQNIAANRAHHSHGMLNSDINSIFNKNEKPLFSPSTKAYKVMVFINGVVNEPIKILLNHRNCRSFEHLLRFLSSLLKLPTGQIRKVYDAASFKKLQGLHDLQDGMNLIAVTNDNVKKMQYQLVDPLFKAPNAPNVAPTIAHFFPNGDPYHLGISVSITKKRFTGLQKLLDHLNNQIELVTGKVQQIYTMEGEGAKIQKIEDIESGKGYILVANNDPLIRIRYNTKAIQNSPSHGLGGITMKNEHMSRIRKVTEHWTSKQQKSMNTQPSFTESIKEQPPKQAENKNRATPKASKSQTKSIASTPKQKSEVSEQLQGIIDDGNISDSGNHDEVYGEKEVQQFSKKSNPQTPRAPGISYKKPETASPKSNNRSVATTPKTDLRSAVASPKEVTRSNVTSAKSITRSSVASPDPVSRSAVASPKQVSKSGVQTPNALSRLRSAGATSSVASEASEASEIFAEEKVSRPQSEAKSIKEPKKGSKDDLKSQKKSNDQLSIKGSKDDLKSRKNSNDQLSIKGSQEQLKAGGIEKLVRSTTAGSQ